MSEETKLRDLFDRWKRVWHEGEYEDLPPFRHYRGLQNHV